MSLSEKQSKKLRRMILLKCSKMEKLGNAEQKKVARAMRDKVDDIMRWYEKNRRDMTAEDLRQVIGIESCEVPW